MDQQRAQEFTDYILKRPELIDEFETLFNNINEIQKMTGRGTGGKVDFVLTELVELFCLKIKIMSF